METLNTMTKNLKPLHEFIAEKLISELKAGTSPFQKPWNDSAPAFLLPHNPTSGKHYRGMNTLWLGMQGFSDPRWMTLKQADFAGYTVEKGAKATVINFVRDSKIEAVRGENGEKLKDEEGKTITNTIKFDKPVVTTAFVFNAEQIKGIPPLETHLQQDRNGQAWSPIERAENLVAASQADIRHAGNEAWYDQQNDRIQLPAKSRFDSAAKYYATLLHEIGHWTGHESRLNRDLSGGFGSENYAREELRAEIASLMIGSEMQIGHHFGQHAAYVDSWIQVLQNEPYELFKASADAQRMMDFMLDIEKRSIKQETSVKQLLERGDQIVYNGTGYKVAEVTGGKMLEMENLLTGKSFKLKTSDGLYASLLNAKYNPPEPELRMENSRQQERNHSHKR